MEKIIAGVPQGSVLGPLLFNIIINDLFLFVSSPFLSNYADDNTLYASGFNLEEVKNCLSTDFDAVTKWFYDNHMVSVIFCVLEKIQEMKPLISKI